ncbi:hypothetical protein EYF80_060321 [Liparis tanakae]|uniref:Uncharacterized protein n=1 Tax=Liparis tanakae TaxID=230148 RepID=A0A4Z2ELT3_9TELE|nr:hypothetical protein EYF80_060321 [Liparis tanakae]
MFDWRTPVAARHRMNRVMDFPGDSWYGPEGQEGLAFKVIRHQDVVVQDRQHKASARSLALTQGHQADEQGPRSEDGERRQRVEVAAPDARAARLQLGEGVLGLQTQLHEGVAETWQSTQNVRPPGRGRTAGDPQWHNGSQGGSPLESIGKRLTALNTSTLSLWSDLL